MAETFAFETLIHLIRHQVTPYYAKNSKINFTFFTKFLYPKTLWLVKGSVLSKKLTKSKYDLYKICFLKIRTLIKFNITIKVLLCYIGKTRLE